MGKSQQFNGYKVSDSEPAYGDNSKYIKTKIKIYRDKANTNFQAKKCQKKIHHTNVCH